MSLSKNTTLHFKIRPFELSFELSFERIVENFHYKTSQHNPKHTIILRRPSSERRLQVRKCDRKSLIESTLVALPVVWRLYLHSRWLNKLGLASIQYEPADLPVGKHRPRRSTFRSQSLKAHWWVNVVVFFSPCEECYSEASDHEEAESTDLPPPPYSEQTLRDSVGASGPPGSTHQVSGRFGFSTFTTVLIYT